MIRGTTPTHVFTIPFDVSAVADLRVSYGQYEREILVKKKEDCVLEGNTISVTLSQEDTFLFDSSKTTTVQVRVLTIGGQALSSDPLTMSVEKSLNNEVLSV